MGRKRTAQKASLDGKYIFALLLTGVGKSPTTISYDSGRK